MTITFDYQEIANRLASRNNFLKDIVQFRAWKRINKTIDKVKLPEETEVLVD